MDGKLEANQSLLDSSRASSAAKDMLKSLARTDPYYKRNRSHLCSFFAKGECNRGNECPYRHELPQESEMSHQNIKDRFYGRNDPVAKKILSTHAVTQGLQPPDDQAVTSLFITSLPATATESSVRTSLLSTIPFIPPTAVKSVVHVEKSRCAFINFKERKDAERAAEAWASGVEVDGTQVNVKWGRSRGAAGATSGGGASGSASTSGVADRIAAQ